MSHLAAVSVVRPTLRSSKARSGLKLGPNAHIPLLPHLITSALHHLTASQEGRVQLHQRAGTGRTHAAFIRAYPCNCSVLLLVTVHVLLYLIHHLNFILGVPVSGKHSVRRCQ